MRATQPDTDTAMTATQMKDLARDTDLFAKTIHLHHLCGEKFRHTSFRMSARHGLQKFSLGPKVRVLRNRKFSQLVAGKVLGASLIVSHETARFLE